METGGHCVVGSGSQWSYHAAQCAVVHISEFIAPRTASGSVELSAAAPLTNGQPDFSGVWMTGEPACVIRGTAPVSELRRLIPPSLKCPVRPASFSRQSINLGIDMPDGTVAR